MVVSNSNYYCTAHTMTTENNSNFLHIKQKSEYKKVHRVRLELGLVNHRI